MKPSTDPNSSLVGRNSSKLKRVLIPIGIIFLGFIILFAMTLMADKPQKKELIKKAPLVEVFEVTRKKVIFEIESQGSIVPRTETTLVSEVSGQIKNVSDKFVVGGFFKKDELLLEIDPISYQVALLQAQARLDGANAKLIEERARGKQAEKEWGLTGRSKKNAPILALRKPQLQQALADVKAAEADVKSAQIKLRRTKIIAPYDAMVKAKSVDIGQYVSTGTQLATTFAIDYAEIRLPIKENDLPYINIPAMGQVNQKGSLVELSSIQGGKIKKWMTFITRSEGIVDATSRVNYVVAQIDDPYGLLDKNATAEIIRIGTFVNAKIIGIETSSVFAIPRKAVRGANEIYLVGENQKLNVALVKILRSDNNAIYVSSGLNQGDQVVLTKLATAVDGMKLRLKAPSLAALVDNNNKSVKAGSPSDIRSITAGKEKPEVNKNNGDKIPAQKKTTEKNSSAVIDGANL